MAPDRSPPGARRAAGRQRVVPWLVCEATSLRAKYLLYAIIVGAAGYWGIFGTFLDFWDAFLWIAAFVFIERNVFEWEKELETGDPGRQ